MHIIIIYAHSSVGAGLVQPSIVNDLLRRLLPSLHTIIIIITTITCMGFNLASFPGRFVGGGNEARSNYESLCV